MGNFASIDNLNLNLRGVYKKILVELWTMDWVKSSHLLSVTEQKYFDRRIRELRDEFGFDIESKHIGGEWSYRLKSKSPRFSKRRRKYPNSKERENLIKRDGVKCNICGYMPPSEEIKGFLQYDHRKPFNVRNGLTSLENLQLLCSQCNVIKRRACQVCNKETCDNCPYAYPEKFGAIYLITFSKNEKEMLEKDAENVGLNVEEYIKRIVGDHKKQFHNFR